MNIWTGKCWLVVLSALVFCASCGTALAQEISAGDKEFFEKKIRPLLIEHCYKCHSAEAKELKGELRLDLKAGWQAGGESGGPAVVPGKPDESPLVRAVRLDDDVSAMPPNQPQLPEAAIG
jgi:hypothetical protein